MYEVFVHKVSSPYRPEQLFELINAVDHYPEFIPWCTGARILSEKDASMTAELTGTIAGFSRTVTSENTFTKPHTIQLKLLNAPVKDCTGSWSLITNPDSGHTDITLTIRYLKPRNPLYFGLRKLIEPACEHIIKSFVKRADEHYG